MKAWIFAILFSALSVDGAVIVSSGAGAKGNAVMLQGRAVSATAPTDTQVLTYDAASSSWKPANSAGGGAGSGDFLADGTVPMTGDLDMNGHAIQNASDVNGPDGMNISSAGNLNLIPAGGSKLVVYERIATSSSGFDLGENGVGFQNLYLAGQIYDAANTNFPSIDVANRKLLTTDGTTSLLDWSGSGPVLGGSVNFSSYTTPGVLVNDASGNITSTTSANINAATATALAANPAACSAGQYVSDIDANGTLTCSAPSGTQWYINANQTATNFLASTGAVASWTELSSATGNLVPVSGSAAAGVMCSGTNAATAPSTGTTTCAAGNEVFGISFAIPSAGKYRVCATFTWASSIPSGANITPIFQMIETPTNAQTDTLEGGAKSQANITAPGGVSVGGQYPIQNCSIFDWSGKAANTVVGIRMKYQQDVTGVPSFSSIIGDGGTPGSRHINWQAYRIPYNQ